ncbi:unnamed protein product [Symbiodinium microadriaticum]|nr:unnamed protein product [Symbiodinium microadriaticum]
METESTYKLGLSLKRVEESCPESSLKETWEGHRCPGALVGVRIWVPDGDAKKTSRVAMRGYTDNQSNESLLRKAMFPSMLVLMELAEELSVKNCELQLQLQWMRRDLNQLANDLTNENFARST